MDKIRDLLLDVRIELRSLVKDFMKSDLCRRIDEARSELTRGGQSGSVVVPADAPSMDHVAQAWRTAAEDLKVTAPAIYELLAKKAARHLAARAASALTSAQPESAAAAPAPASADLAPVTAAAIGAPIPVLAEGAVLTEAAATAQAEPEAPPAAAAEPEIDPNIPTRHVLDLIARSKRRFTESQREWCVGEALVRSEFQIQPNDFIALGDHGMAKYLLETDPEAQSEPGV